MLYCLGAYGGEDILLKLLQYGKQADFSITDFFISYTQLTSNVVTMLFLQFHELIVSSGEMW